MISTSREVFVGSHARDMEHKPSELLDQLLGSSLLVSEDWENLPEEMRAELLACPSTALLLSQLIDHGLLTNYQADRMQAGKLEGLILGSYRILNRLGSGSMGIVYEGEHLVLRRRVAIKVLALEREQSPKILFRFLSEMKALAQLHHPHIVAVLDAGQAPSSNPDAPVLHYLVMEYIAGENLEEHVGKNGPLPAGKACELMYQIADALAEADKHHLVHRDIKPSNILLTPDGRAKLLDFGLTRRYQFRVTEPGTTMGTLDYIAPEQAKDASTVDIRADLYGLGGTLFWCLTGRTPFEPKGTLTEELSRRLSQAPPLIRVFRPDIATELEKVIQRMMACNPDDRFPTPQAVMNALMPFLAKGSLYRSQPLHVPQPAEPVKPMQAYHLLIVDDDPRIRSLCRAALNDEGLPNSQASDARQALALVRQQEFDLILMDMAMPGMTGLELAKKVRENPPTANLKIIMFSGHLTGDELAQMMQAGVDDYLTKPFSVNQLVARIKAALRLKETQDRSDLLRKHLSLANQQLGLSLDAKNRDLVDAHQGLVLALAKLVEYRDIDSGKHLMRLPRYCRVLAEEAAKLPSFGERINSDFIQQLEWCAPLHDIGKAGMPDRILLKEGALDDEETALMQAHTLIGAETLQEVSRQHGSAMGFLHVAIDIARHHHERFDGAGYPDRLAGSSIPLCARILSIADVYDALRSRRVYKPALPHSTAMEIMTKKSPGKFDPALLLAFQRCADQFERIYKDLAE